MAGVVCVDERSVACLASAKLPMTPPPSQCLLIAFWRQVNVTQHASTCPERRGVFAVFAEVILRIFARRTKCLPSGEVLGEGIGIEALGLERCPNQRRQLNQGKLACGAKRWRTQDEEKPAQGGFARRVTKQLRVALGFCHRSIDRCAHRLKRVLVTTMEVLHKRVHASIAWPRRNSACDAVSVLGSAKRYSIHDEVELHRSKGSKSGASAQGKPTCGHLAYVKQNLLKINSLRYDIGRLVLHNNV